MPRPTKKSKDQDKVQNQSRTTKKFPDIDDDSMEMLERMIQLAKSLDQALWDGVRSKAASTVKGIVKGTDKTESKDDSLEKGKHSHQSTRNDLNREAGDTFDSVQRLVRADAAARANNTPQNGPNNAEETNALGEELNTAPPQEETNTLDAENVATPELNSTASPAPQMQEMAPKMEALSTNSPTNAADMGGGNAGLDMGQGAGGADAGQAIEKNPEEALDTVASNSQVAAAAL